MTFLVQGTVKLDFLNNFMDFIQHKAHNLPSFIVDYQDNCFFLYLLSISLGRLLHWCHLEQNLDNMI